VESLFKGCARFLGSKRSGRFLVAGIARTTSYHSSLRMVDIRDQFKLCCRTSPDARPFSNKCNDIVDFWKGLLWSNKGEEPVLAVVASLVL
jgi:hypothetical protein